MLEQFHLSLHWHFIKGGDLLSNRLEPLDLFTLGYGHLKQFDIEINEDSRGPLLYTGVVRSEIIVQITPYVERHFGIPYKGSGKSAMMKNLFDPFNKALNGLRKEQTAYRMDISRGLILYCAFWPWGSNPDNTSVRIGLLCKSKEEENQMSEALKEFFQ